MDYYVPFHVTDNFLVHRRRIEWRVFCSKVAFIAGRVDFLWSLCTIRKGILSTWACQQNAKVSWLIYPFRYFENTLRINFNISLHVHVMYMYISALFWRIFKLCRFQIMMGVAHGLVKPQMSTGQELTGEMLSKICTQRTIWLVPSENLVQQKGFVAKRYRDRIWMFK